MSTKRSIILRGTPEVNEYGAANAAIKPGYLVKACYPGSTAVAVQTVSNAKVPANVALERDELGAGIDDTYLVTGSGAPAAAYASGDVVKVAAFRPGDEATLWIASGQNIQADEYLSSAGDGTVKAEATFANAIAQSLEEVGAVTVLTAIRVRFV